MKKYALLALLLPVALLVAACQAGSPLEPVSHSEALRVQPEVETSTPDDEIASTANASQADDDLLDALGDVALYIDVPPREIDPVDEGSGSSENGSWCYVSCSDGSSCAWTGCEETATCSCDDPVGYAAMCGCN